MERTARRGFGLIQAALPLAAVVIEFCWLYPWLLFLTGALYGHMPTPLLPGWPAFLLLMLGAVIVRRALATPWSLTAVRATVVGSGMLAGLIVVKATYYPGYAFADPRWIGVLFRAAHDALPVVLPPVAGAMTAALLWWRGVVLGERDFSYIDIDRLFRNGIGWSVFFVILFAIYHDTRAFALASFAPVYLLAFFSLSLLTLAIARLVDLWIQSQADEQQALAMNRHWFVLLVGVVGLILLAAILLSGAMPTDLRPTLARLFTPLLPVVEVIFSVIFWIALAIARVIIYLISRLPWRSRVVPQPSQTDPLSDFLKRLQEVQINPTVVSGARWGMVLLAVALLCLLIAVAIVRARRRQRKPGEDERESVWSTQALLSGLGSALRSWWGRLRAAPGVTETTEMTEIAAIRAIYRNLLRWAAEQGARRRPDQTPYEFLPRLRDAAAPHDAQATALTDMYIAVRYTPHLPTRAEVEEARRALERIITEEEGAI